MTIANDSVTPAPKSWAERLGRLMTAGSEGAPTASRRRFLGRAGAAAVAMPALASGGFARADTTPVAPSLVTLFNSILAHENEHVDFLVDALGKHARPKPTFMGLEQPTFYRFAQVSQILENTGVGAYLAALPSIDSAEYLAAAGSIALIEARHASALNFVLNDPVTAGASDLTEDESFEAPLSAAQVVVAANKYIQSLNGGPALGFENGPSPKNDVNILNFALALEYLEAEFYSVNVEKFLT